MKKILLPLSLLFLTVSSPALAKSRPCSEASLDGTYSLSVPRTDQKPLTQLVEITENSVIMSTSEAAFFCRGKCEIDGSTIRINYDSPGLCAGFSVNLKFSPTLLKEFLTILPSGENILVDTESDLPGTIRKTVFEQ